jgi:Ca-activated chloride channel family protein
VRFADQPYLWLLVLIPGLTALYVVASILRRRALERFGETGMLAKLTASVSLPMRRLKAVFVVAGCGFLALALARPQYGSKLEMVQRMGVDVIIAIDASASMLAEDVPPNRLEFAKHEMSGLIRRLRGDRVGIIAFAGDAFVQCPLTLDYGAAEMFIDEIDVGTVPRPGTDLGRAIEVAAGAFGAGSRKSKVLVLLTDGEDLEAGAVEAAERAARAGVRIHTVGIGSGEGVPIPVREESGQLREYKKDRAGEMVMSRLDEPTLRRVARAALGSYYRATFDASELDALYREMAAMEQAEQGALEYTSFEDRFQWVLAVALVLLAAEVVLSDRRRVSGRRRRGERDRRGVRGRWCVWGPSVLLSMVALLVVSTAPGWADPERKMRRGNSLYEREKYDEAIQAYREAQLEAPDSKELWYNVGNALYRKGAFEGAVGEYEGAAGAPDGKVKEWSAYNTGNALYRGQQYQEAVEAYKRALRLDPNDRDAKFNLELAQDRLQEMQQQQQQQEQGEGRDQEQQQKQQDQGEQQDQQQQQQQQQEQQQEQRQEREDQKDQQQQQPEERQGEQQEEQQPPPQPREGELSKQEVARLLDALQEQEEKVREEMREAQAVGQVGVDRDW